MSAPPAWTTHSGDVMLPDRSFYSRIAPLIGLFAGLFVGSALSDEIGAAVMFAWMMR